MYIFAQICVLCLSIWTQPYHANVNSPNVYCANIFKCALLFYMASGCPSIQFFLFVRLFSVFFRVVCCNLASLFIDYIASLFRIMGFSVYVCFNFQLFFFATVKSFILLPFINTHFALISYFQHFFHRSNACHSKYRTFLIKFPRAKKWVVIMGNHLARKIFKKCVFSVWKKMNFPWQSVKKNNPIFKQLHRSYSNNM